RVMPYKREIIGILQRNSLEIRYGKFCRSLHQFPIVQKVLPSAMKDSAILRLAGVTVDVPVRRRCADQHLSRRCPGAAQREPRAAHAAAASCAMVVNFRIGGRLLDLYLFPV